MPDIVIRGGTIVDGTGKAAFSGDVAIADGRIAAVGGKQGPGRRDIDAGGLLVTPGWVDIHPHYDGQAMWDPLLAPSCWHGVTTVMFGNCGGGFAPVKKHHRRAPRSGAPAPSGGSQPRPTISPRCAASPSRRCAPAPSASRPRARTRTR